ncbi:MAG: GNAT family N-acetyltransferase [Verrucomicrobiota bacterium]|nr:GNAT family N-acetyltransferase [Limisphaera sp.]MDW8380942.1 GNAT family N-acetyltransferase [Verrucomicrobiota bacterium]
MKLLFSEARPDYDHYIFPYAVWAFPEPGETPADLMTAGFLPSSRQLDRFYLCRQIRVCLERYKASSENRRILRRGELFQADLQPRASFKWNAAHRQLCLACAEARFGPGKMTEDKLDELFHAPLTTHVLHVRLRQDGSTIGLATLYLEGTRLGFYSYGFYDLNWRTHQLGMFMMTYAVDSLARSGVRHLHLGTCYTTKAWYKTQFAGVEFFNGFRWSDNLEELRHLLARDQRPVLTEHLLESPEYRQAFNIPNPADLACRWGMCTSLPTDPAAQRALVRSQVPRIDAPC